MYSAEAFAVAQVIPYSILCTVVNPVGFDQGPTGLSGTGFKLLVILFVELYGVTFAQLIGAISPSIQIVTLFDPLLATVCGYPGICEWAGSTTSILSLALWAG